MNEMYLKNQERPYTKFYNLWRRNIRFSWGRDHSSWFVEIPAGLKQKNIKSIVTIHDLILCIQLYSFR
jgi:hypothetical protein